MISTEESVHQRRFASAESPDKQQVELVFRKACENIPAFGLQSFVFRVDGLRGSDDVGYPKFLLLVLFQIHEFQPSLSEAFTTRLTPGSGTGLTCRFQRSPQTSDSESGRMAIANPVYPPSFFGP